MKVAKEVKYTYRLTTLEQQLVKMLDNVNDILDKSEAFNCPKNGCSVCPFKNDKGRDCPFIRLDEAVIDIVNKAKKIEKGEIVCPPQ